MEYDTGEKGYPMPAVPETKYPHGTHHLFEALESVSDGFWSWNPSTGEVWLNQGSLALFGFSPSDPPKTSDAVFSRVHPDDIAAVQDALQRHINGESSRYRCEFRALSPDGQTRWLLGRGRLTTLGDAARSTLIIGTNDDITERKRAEHALKRSEERYRQLAETTNDVIMVHDMEGRLRYLNRAGALLMGCSEADVTGRSVTEIVPENYTTLMQRNRERRARGLEGLARYEIEVLNASGERIALDVNSTVASYEGVPCVLIVARDIRERKDAESRLAHRLEAEQLIAKTAAALMRVSGDDLDPIIHAALSDLGKHLNVDQTCMCLQTDASKGNTGELIWTSAHAPAHPDDRTGRCLRELPYLTAQLRHGRNFACTDTALLPDEARQEQVLFTRLGVKAALFAPLEAGEELFGLLALYDMKAPRAWQEETCHLLRIMASVLANALARRAARATQKELQQQLLQSQKMESMGRLAGGVAHDFNNMLGVILGHTELALEQVTTGEAIREDLENILSAANRSADLTRQLLTFARKQDSKPVTIDLNAAIGELLNMLRRLMGDGIELIWSPCDNIWSVRMDPSQLDQVLANLCINARDAITGTGQVFISTQNMAGVEEEPNQLVPDQVVLEVRDTGVGMDAETASRLFEPFFTTKPRGRGTGLGLSTVYGIVTQHQGHLDVVSAPGEGATFRVYFPRALPAPTPRKDPFEGGRPSGTGETILVVEDEEPLLNMTSRMLQVAGYRTLIASCPSEALAVVAAAPRKIDLLLTDVIMPERNGRELAEELLALFPDLPVLYMSGHPAEVVSGGAVLPHGTSFLRKPFSQVELVKMVHDSLNRA